MPKRPPKKNKIRMSEQTQPTPEITLQDIANAIKVIDVSSTRGAFKGEELSSVGTLRDKLDSYLQHHAPPPEENQDADEAADDAGSQEAEVGDSAE